MHNNDLNTIIGFLDNTTFYEESNLQIDDLTPNIQPAIIGYATQNRSEFPATLAFAWPEGSVSTEEDSSQNLSSDLLGNSDQANYVSDNSG